ncbi:regulatory protein TetR [Syntrophobotulus glycolicus DSM 8271]|uniref:Regulatory protein TetR n=1 Tax=Syntrophobotulus glycolicus (strain DSM 8271 / FlGlyR) TaxID=645991 RepID=F0SV50_SYNGF|nr:TetR/AcrR family transcriptional regulator [Syntrophobotulus glycolicus]ADY55550.1 regulatory protein TetR [Syntrophobotulus glycolicus DSM 8271]
MSPKIFALKEREEARIKMLEAGLALIREHGMTHASVEKVTRAVGLGKSTFYNFFPSKEMFVYEIIQYQRDRAKQFFMDTLDGREKMTTPEAKAFLRKIIFSENSIYQYLTAEDEARLKAALPPEFRIDPQAEAVVMRGLFTHMEGVRPDVDFPLAANLIKIMALAMLNQDALHPGALARTLDRIYDLLFSCIFTENA